MLKRAKKTIYRIHRNISQATPKKVANRTQRQSRETVSEGIDFMNPVH